MFDESAFHQSKIDDVIQSGLLKGVWVGLWWLDRAHDQRTRKV